MGGFRSDTPYYDDFALANLDRYTFTIDTSSNVEILNQKIKPAFSGNKAFYYTGSPFNQQSNAILTVKHHFYDFVGSLPALNSFILDTDQLETPIAGVYEVGLMSRRQSNGDYLLGMVNKTSLTIYKRVGGINTLLATSVLGASLVDDNDYWIRFVTLDDSITLEHWTTDPELGGSPATIVTHTVAGTGVESPTATGQYGIGWWNVTVLDSSLDDFRMVPLQPSLYSTPTSLSVEKHIDIRDFYQNDLSIPRPLSELNKRHMEQVEASDLSVLEFDVSEPGEFDMASLGETSVFIGENWTVRGNGYSDTSLEVKRLEAYNNWRGAVIYLNNTIDPTSVTIDSNSYLTPTNILALDAVKSNIYISMIIPDMPVDVDLSQSLIQFTSHPRGQFDQLDVYVASTMDSTPVSLSSFAGGEFKVPLTDFEVGSNIDWTRVTAVRIKIVGNVGANLNGKTVSILSIRAVLNTWDVRDMLVNTRRGILVSPVTENATLTPRPLHVSPFLRISDQANMNPTIGDLVYNMKFNTGLTTNATTRNTLQFYLRAYETSGTTQSFIVAQVDYRSNDVQLSLYKMHRDISGSLRYDKMVGTSRIWKKTSVTPLPGELAPFSPDSKYQFSVEALSNSIRLVIYSMDGSGIITGTHFDTGYISDSSFVREFGLAGWWANFPDEKDNYIDDVSVESISYATLRTKVFYTNTPVDGAQLFTESAPDSDSFRDFMLLNETDTLSFDNVKTLSGTSYKFSGGAQDTPAGLRTNTFVINDWENAYLEFDIWAPQEIFFSENEGRRPSIYFKTPGSFFGIGAGTGTLGPVPLKFVPGNWTKNKIDLSFFKDRATGEYEIWLCQDYVSTDSWWVDNFRILQRSVSWEIRANQNDEWIPFKSMINNNKYAIHFTQQDRGFEVQLQARALTPDAWISSYTLIPHYAHLGRILPGQEAGPHNIFYPGDHPAVNDSNLSSAFTGTVGGRGIISSAEEMKALTKTGSGTSPRSALSRTIYAPGDYTNVQTYIDEVNDQNLKSIRSSKNSSTISYDLSQG